MRVQMLGLCRFSYLGERGFQVAHDTIEARRAFLYDPDRLARRWFWFEYVTLPGLLAQTDSDFTLVVMTGPDLPEPYLSRLQDLARTVPQIRLALIPRMEAHLKACLAAVAPHIEKTADVIGHFRQDDDDAVAVDYIQHARADFTAIHPLWLRRRRLSCDYSRGVLMKLRPEGISAGVRVIHNASAGLTIYLPPDAGHTAVHYSHWQLGLSMPGVTLADKMMYARVLHDDNDSGAIGAGYSLPEQLSVAAMRERFRIDLPGLRRMARDRGLTGIRPDPEGASASGIAPTQS